MNETGMLGRRDLLLDVLSTPVLLIGRATRYGLGHTPQCGRSRRWKPAQSQPVTTVDRRDSAAGCSPNGLQTQGSAIYYGWEMYRARAEIGHSRTQPLWLQCRAEPYMIGF